jgi:beta-glucosidase
MTSSDNTRRAFPDGFMWGTSTAAYQIEGAVAEDGRTPSIWDTFSHTPGKTTNGDTGDDACDHYHRWEEDLDLLKQLGVQAYRFSIAWPRIHPDVTGPANEKGLDFYKNLIAGLHDRGITPLPTMFHWDLPQSLEDVGGWTNRDTAYRFADYAATVLERLDGISKWTTFNEPWTSSWLGYAYGHHAPGRTDIGAGWAATHHQLLAHGLAVQAARDIVPDVEIGLTLNLGALRSGTQEQVDLDATRRTDGNLNRIWLDPLFKGSYPEDMLEIYDQYAPGAAVIEAGDLEIISTPIDFLGVNFYGPGTVMGEGREDAARAAGFNVGPKPEGDSVNHLHAIGVETPGRPRTAMEWEIDASGLRELLVRIKNDYTDIPLYITENGCAAHDYVGTDGRVKDPDRVRYLDQHLDACLAAIDDGVNLKGYFIWSLLDNFEWGFGYSRRFGIVWIDYDTKRRIPKSSFHWYQGVTQTNELPPLDEALANLK